MGNSGETAGLDPTRGSPVLLPGGSRLGAASVPMGSGVGRAQHPAGHRPPSSEAELLPHAGCWGRAGPAAGPSSSPQTGGHPENQGGTQPAPPKRLQLCGVRALGTGTSRHHSGASQGRFQLGNAEAVFWGKARAAALCLGQNTSGQLAATGGDRRRRGHALQQRPQNVGESWEGTVGAPPHTHPHTFAACQPCSGAFLPAKTKAAPAGARLHRQRVGNAWPAPSGAQEASGRRRTGACDVWGGRGTQLFASRSRIPPLLASRQLRDPAGNRALPAEPPAPRNSARSAGAQPQPVSGVRGRSVLLSLALPNSSRVKTAEWYFRAGMGKNIQVAEFGPNGFERPDPHDRFQQRLEMPNATALRIGGLEPGDSGVYGVWIKYHSTAEVEDQEFNLSVYEATKPFCAGRGRGRETAQHLPGERGFSWSDEGSVLHLRLHLLPFGCPALPACPGCRGWVPVGFFSVPPPEPVPPPQIRPQLLSRSPQGCNVTLRCSLPPTNHARTSWQLGNTSGTLWGQSGDSQTLWLAIPPSALDATYTCVARSPAEEQSSSVSLSALCQLGKAPHIPPTVILGWGGAVGTPTAPQFVPAEGGRQRWAICMGVLAAVGGLLSVLCCLRRRRRKAEEGGGHPNGDPDGGAMSPGLWGGPRTPRSPSPARLPPAAPGVAEEPQYAQVPRRGPAKEDEAVRLGEAARGPTGQGLGTGLSP
ncbi:SLAM family member 8 [Aix galericulata]|nr:SLAM family member 8 [Aix galericulata]